jgi:uncharacterized protein YggE
MPTIRLLPAATSLILLLAGPVPAAAQAPGTEVRPPPAPGASPRTLRVSATGRVSVKPDVAVVRTGVRVTAKDAAKASADANARMKTLLAELARLGVAEKDVQTSEFSLVAERPWDNGKQLPVQGYTAANTVTVKVRKLDGLPALLGRLPAVGANAVDGVQFTKDELGPSRDEALTLAVQAARARAEAVAKAAGVKLGEVISIEVEGGAQPVPMMAMAMKAQGTEDAAVAPGELDVNAGVDMTFAIR